MTINIVEAVTTALEDIMKGLTEIAIPSTTVTEEEMMTGSAGERSVIGMIVTEILNQLKIEIAGKRSELKIWILLITGTAEERMGTGKLSPIMSESVEERIGIGTLSLSMIVIAGETSARERNVTMATTAVAERRRCSVLLALLLLVLPPKAYGSTGHTEMTPTALQSHQILLKAPASAPAWKVVMKNGVSAIGGVAENEKKDGNEKNGRRKSCEKQKIGSDVSMTSCRRESWRLLEIKKAVFESLSRMRDIHTTGRTRPRSLLAAQAVVATMLALRTRIPTPSLHVATLNSKIVRAKCVL